MKLLGILIFALGASLGYAAGPKKIGEAVAVLNGTLSQNIETAVLAGGCVWGMEDIIRKIPGVVSTDVGYAGGKSTAVKYEDVKKGDTGHAEAVRVQFDRTVLPYAKLLEYYFRMHDPTTLNRQGNDVGTQYRSAIFYTTETQQKTAQEVLKKTEQSHKWQRPLVTQIVPSSTFVLAEDYHQDYLVKNPQGYTCHWLR